MKLKKLLPLLDGLNKCKIFLAEEEKEEPIFEGYISDVPWTLLDYRLDFSDEEPVSVWYEPELKSEIKVIVPYFNIWITGEENNEAL